MIPASILVILLMSLFGINIPSFMKSLADWMVRHDMKPSMAWFSVIAILVLVITGAFMCGVVILISRLEDRYLKKHQPPVNPAREYDNGIDDIICSVEQSLARIRESSEKMKAQTEQIIELNRRFLAGFVVPSRESPRVKGTPPHETARREISPHGRMMSDRLIGGTDIYALGGSRSFLPKRENLRDYRDVSPEKSPEFIAMIEKITCLLRYTIKK
jgi:hypothetical protein